MVQSLHLAPGDFAPILSDLAIEPANVIVVDPARPSAVAETPPIPDVCLLCGPIAADADVARAAQMFRERGERALPNDGWALFFLEGRRTDAELARWRNQLWPWLHVVCLHRIGGGTTTRETLQGNAAIGAGALREGVILTTRRREHVLSPGTTVAKFDTNAGGWNGEPGRPGYAHFRWMRKYVALFGAPARGERILDFGCGAGWVGIEAALAADGAPLAAFDPSPEMVRICEQNARASGLAEFVGRAGFGEHPPFDERFDLVISSGVVSFSPDHDAWFDGLARCVKPGGKLVIGDLNRDSRGMQQRRATRPLLPARELNALSAEQARRQLEQRGFHHQRTAGYQRTRPIPQLAHWSDRRLHGALSPLLLACNKLSAGPTEDLGAFDSWVISQRAP